MIFKQPYATKSRILTYSTGLPVNLEGLVMDPLADHFDALLPEMTERNQSAFSWVGMVMSIKNSALVTTGWVLGKHCLCEAR